MKKNLSKLLSISSPALCDSQLQSLKRLLTKAGKLGEDLIEFLRFRNGFYAFESALHVLPSNCLDSRMDIERWNQADLWKEDYGNVVKAHLFFAEDIFGEQFSILDNYIFRFDPETANFEEFATSLEDWAERILNNYEIETGYPIAFNWQEQNGSLPVGQRLVPKTPFILGGEYEIENLYALDAVKGMKLRADIWKQIKDLPNGTKVEIKIINSPDNE